MVVLAPVAAVAVMSLSAAEGQWAHLVANVLPRQGINTLVLMAGVAALTAGFGTACAWLVTAYAFPGRGWLTHALLLPLAIPAYVGAYAVVDFLDYSGWVQTTLRGTFGWQTARDYWFPEVRGQGMAIVVLSAALYPYVYLLARAAFREASGATCEVARALGAGPWGVFWRVGLPLARPAVAAGVALALMETAADFGTVQHFGVPTLTSAIFAAWLGAGDAGSAARIACLLLMLVAGLVVLERTGRRGARFHRMGRTAAPPAARRLAGWRGWCATAFCLVPFAAGFVLPVGVMLALGLRHPHAWLAPDLGRALLNTVVVSAVAAAVAVGAAIVLCYAVRLSGRTLPRRLAPLTMLGYAAPGAVLAVGILIPLAALDHRLADAVQWLTGRDPGLLLTGTAFALVLAYAVRFFAVAQGAVDAAFGRVAPALPLAARTLGRGPGGALAAVHLPLMRGSVAMAALIVFVDCVKELPATLLLRPFGWHTLSTRTYELATLERLGEAAPAALAVMAVGAVAVLALAHSTRDPATPR